MPETTVVAIEKDKSVTVKKKAATKKSTTKAAKKKVSKKVAKPSAAKPEAKITPTTAAKTKGAKRSEASPLSNADPSKVICVETKGGHRGKVFGNSTVNFMRWLGSLQANVPVASVVCRKLKVQVAPGTMRISLTQGRNKKYAKEVAAVKMPPEKKKEIEKMVKDELTAIAKH